MPGPDNGTKLIVIEQAGLQVPADRTKWGEVVKKANETHMGYVNNVKKNLETK